MLLCREIASSAFEVLAVGLPLFFTQRTQRVAWLKDFFARFLPLDHSKVAAMQPVLQIVTERLSLDPDSTYYAL